MVGVPSKWHSILTAPSPEVWIDSWAEVGNRGRLETDDLVPTPEGGHFERVFTVEQAKHTPLLMASDELKGWSLLSWTGPLAYVGQHTVIDPDGDWLPSSMSLLDALIEEVVGA